ncbi:MAG: methyl-accepting chemotaxis protein [Myxococcota bacterium]|jgi:methyl-accepting chemotaxis protein|nr:methyl-accepting chemotaxis protein [Myxococcota bacterium]
MMRRWSKQEKVPAAVAAVGHSARRAGRSVQRRILVVTALGVLIPVAAVMIFFSMMLSGQIEDGLKLKAQAIADLVAANVGPAIDFNDPDSAKNSLEGLLKDADLTYLMVLKGVGKDETVFAGLRAEQQSGVPKHFRAGETTFFSTPSTLNIAQPVFVAGESGRPSKVGVVQIGFSTVRLSKIISSGHMLIASIAALLILFLTALVWIMLRRAVFGPIERLAGAVVRVGKGDLRPWAEELKEYSDIKEFAVILDAYEQARLSLRGSVSAIRRAARILNESSGELATSMNRLSASASEQAAALAENSATVTEIRQMSFHASSSAQNIVRTASQTVTISDDGLQSVRQTAERIRSLRNQVEDAAIRIEKVSSQLGEVENIIYTVNGIAEQSNVLAINASIEAAEAGQHGQGFMVVAREVRTLASQSKDATVRVRGTLDIMHRSILDTVSSTLAGRKGAEQSVRIIEATGEVIDSLAKAIRDTAQAAELIAATSVQQLTGIDQVVDALASIQTASQDTVSAMTTVERTSRDVLATANELSGLVSHYKID